MLMPAKQSRTKKHTTKTPSNTMGVSRVEGPVFPYL